MTDAKKPRMPPFCWVYMCPHKPTVLVSVPCNSIKRQPVLIAVCESHKRIQPWGRP